MRLGSYSCMDPSHIPIVIIIILIWKRGKGGKYFTLYTCYCPYCKCKCIRLQSCADLRFFFPFLCIHIISFNVFCPFCSCSLFYFQGIATGKYHGAILTNNEDWEGKGLEAGRVSGDLLAPIVYCPELHFAEFSSSVADMKNSVAVSFVYFGRIIK